MLSVKKSAHCMVTGVSATLFDRVQRLPRRAGAAPARPRWLMTCRSTCWCRRSAPCSTSCPTCDEKCCSPRCGTSAHASARRWRSQGGTSAASAVSVRAAGHAQAARVKGGAPGGRRAAGVAPHRLVPLPDAQYVTQLEMMVATLRIPLERMSEKTGRTEKVRLWDIIDRTART